MQNISKLRQVLTLKQKEKFQEDGFLIVKKMLSSYDLQPIINELSDKVEVGIQSAISMGLLSVDQTFTEATFATRLVYASTACSEPGWIWNNFFRNQKPRTKGMFSVRTAGSLLDAIESIIGPEIFAHPQFNFRAKLPDQQATVIPWHQDLAYLIPSEAADTMVVNAWIPLVPTSVENGCLQLIQGSHKFGLFPHGQQDLTPDHTGNIGIADDHLPSGKIIAAEMSVGDVLLSTERLVHRGLPNRSNMVRWSIDTRYSQIGLPMGRRNVPGFIARSHQVPENVAQSHSDWNQAFKNE